MSWYIGLFLISGSIKNLFSIGYVNICYFSILFPVDFTSWKNVGLPPLCLYRVLLTLIQKITEAVIRNNQQIVGLKVLIIRFHYLKIITVNYYHKALHLGCCSSSRSASVFCSITRYIDACILRALLMFELVATNFRQKLTEFTNKNFQFVRMSAIQLATY